MSEEQLWIEKYKPIHLRDLCGQENITSILEKCIECKSNTHFLFYGPSGTGKTTTIYAFCRELYQQPTYNNPHILEINASHEFDFQETKMKIHMFCKKSTKADSYKMIIIDESDSLNVYIQSSLRRLMEIYSYNTRFCFICNYIYKIIPAIQSRCTLFQFKPIPTCLAISHLSDICRKESIPFELCSLLKLYEYSYHDMRQSIILMQVFASLFEEINETTIDRYFKKNAVDWTNIIEMDMQDLYKHCDTLLYKGHTLRSIELSCIAFFQGHMNQVVKISSFFSFLSSIEKKCQNNVDVKLILFELFLWCRLHFKIEIDKGLSCIL